MTLNLPYHLDERRKADLANRYDYHRPKNGQAERYEEIRLRCKEMAEFLVCACPPGRELSRALTALDDVMFNANAAIARGETEDPQIDDARGAAGRPHGRAEI